MSVYMLILQRLLRYAMMITIFSGLSFIRITLLPLIMLFDKQTYRFEIIA